MQPDFDATLDFDELYALLDEERERQEGGKKLKIVQFTDPLCGWCYGMEPIMTKLRFLLADRLEFSYTLGLMIPSASAIFGDGPDSLKLFSAMKYQLAYGYKMIERTTGMPMGIERLNEMKPENVSSLESSLAYEAVKIAEGPERAIDFMHMMRQAIYGFETSISAREDVAMLANIFGIDMKAYDAAIESGQAKQALDEEVMHCRAMHVEGFPTLLITYEQKSAIVHGYQPEETVAKAISHVSDGAIELSQTEYSKQRMLEFLDRFGRVAAEELRAAFALTPQALVKIANELMDEKLVDIIPCANSFFVARALH